MDYGDFRARQRGSEGRTGEFVAGILSCPHDKIDRIFVKISQALEIRFLALIGERIGAAVAVVEIGQDDVGT